MNKTKNYIIVLTVNNHAGVMSHITGLFARRNFNLEGILCAPLKNSAKSRVYLIIKHGSDIRQISKQLQKLYDVTEVSVLPGGTILLGRINRLFKLANN
ncbi:MAG: ACT domain-containing protein [Candidatus Omnitrophota bacterium]|jgi:acetolactate synthase-1/3 small subunit